MAENVRKILNLPKNAESFWLAELKELSADDTGKNKIIIDDIWMAQRFAEAGLIDAEELEAKEYPMSIPEYVVTDKSLAIDLDNVAASYKATKSRKDILRTNETLSTVDALYIDADVGNKWNFIEFKNGDWDFKDIKTKVYESLVLLNNLHEFDKSAVIKNNRCSNTVEIENLNISEQFMSMTGKRTIYEYCQKNAVLTVVYTGKEHVGKLYKELCGLKSDYKEINMILSEMNIRSLEKAKAVSTQDFGYPYINALANLLISATSVNKNIERYKAIIKMLERFRGKDKKDIKDTLQVLNDTPKLIDWLWDKLYASNGKIAEYREHMYKNKQISGEEFMKLTARASVESFDRFNDEFFKDDYELIKSLFGGSKYKNVIKIEQELEEVLECCECITGKENDILELKKDSFSDIDELLKQGNFEEACKRCIFIERIMSPYSAGNHISEESYSRLLYNIVGMQQEKAEKIGSKCKGNARLLYKCAALWQYFYKEMDIRQRVGDCYVDIVNQMKLLDALLSNSNEHKGKNTKLKYGVFEGRIKEAVSKYKENERKDAVQEEVKKIMTSIELGKTVKEIIPIGVTTRLMVDSNIIKIRRLQTILEGSVLKKVEGCKGIDFIKR